MNRQAVYAGSFDPPTLGHLDIIRRVAPLFDKVHLVIAKNSRKQSWLKVEERVELMKAAIADAGLSAQCEVVSHEGLVVDYCKQMNVPILIRGLRAMSDFEAELQMASMNRKLGPEIETLALMTHEKYHFVSSTLVREVFQFGAGMTGLVPPNVEKYLKERFNNA